MRYCKFSFLVLLAVSQLFLSCDSDDEKITCRPSTIKFPAYTEEYVYNAAHKVETILYHVPDAGTRKGTLDYNEKGQLIRQTLFDFSSPPQPYYVTELIYDGQEKPQKVRHLVLNPDPGVEQEAVNVLQYDEKQRLIERIYTRGQGEFKGIKYEYNDKNNLTKVIRVFESEEILYAENFVFDQRPSVYHMVSERNAINVYMDEGFPIQNNILSFTLHDDQPGYPKTNPMTVTFNVNYDATGKVTKSQPSFITVGPPHFEEVTYNCE
jgi:hypothetical protein